MRACSNTSKRCSAWRRSRRATPRRTTSPTRSIKPGSRPAIELPVVMFDESMLDAACMSAKKHKTELELAADAGIIPAHLDRRRYDRDLAYFIGDYLASHGKGGIRRGR